MRRICCGIAVLMGLALVAPAWAVPWEDFFDSFDTFGTGQTIATADPAHWDESIQGTANGLLLLAAPGGGVALGYNPTTTAVQSRSDRPFGTLDAGTKTYQFSLRVRASTVVTGSDAFCFFKQPSINGFAFNVGIMDGMITLQGDDVEGTEGTGKVLTATAAADTWYDIEVLYTVRPGLANDTLSMTYRAEGGGPSTQLGTLFTRDHDLFDTDPSGNLIICFIRPQNTAKTGNFIDNVAGRTVPGTAAPALGPSALFALVVSLLAVGSVRRRERRTERSPGT